MKPRALILRSAGTNCDRETARAFELAGAESECVHVNRLLEAPSRITDFQILAIPGGFSYGDDISAGRILANQLLHHLREPLLEFVMSGRPVIGICNGFQVLVKMGLLPGGPQALAQTCTLTDNACGRFVDRWVDLAVSSRKCLWTQGLAALSLPIAHGEGRFVCRDSKILEALVEQDQVALRYVGPDGSPARGSYPANPNGSEADIAGLCDPSGVVMGLMPHPERAVTVTQNPSRKGLTNSAQECAGVTIFANAVRHVEAALGAGV